MQRELIYPPCIRCSCPLILFQTDYKHRFLCVRCHEDMAHKGRRSVNPCFCGDIQVCEKCSWREYKFRHDRRNKESNARHARDYYHRHLDKMKEKNKATAKTRKRGKGETTNE